MENERKLELMRGRAKEIETILEGSKRDIDVSEWEHCETSATTVSFLFAAMQKYRK